MEKIWKKYSYTVKVVSIFSYVILPRKDSSIKVLLIENLISLSSFIKLFSQQVEIMIRLYDVFVFNLKLI